MRFSRFLPAFFPVARNFSFPSVRRREETRVPQHALVTISFTIQREFRKTSGFNFANKLGATFLPHLVLRTILQFPRNLISARGFYSRPIFNPGLRVFPFNTDSSRPLDARRVSFFTRREFERATNTVIRVLAAIRSPAFPLPSVISPRLQADSVRFEELLSEFVAARCYRAHAPPLEGFTE